MTWGVSVRKWNYVASQRIGESIPLASPISMWLRSMVGTFSHMHFERYATTASDIKENMAIIVHVSRLVFQSNTSGYF